MHSKASRVIKFNKQVMIADNCYYVDNRGIRHGFSFSQNLKSLIFIGPNAQEFILESNGNSDIKFYSVILVTLVAGIVSLLSTRKIVNEKPLVLLVN